MVCAVRQSGFTFSLRAAKALPRQTDAGPITDCSSHRIDTATPCRTLTHIVHTHTHTRETAYASAQRFHARHAQVTAPCHGDSRQLMAWTVIYGRSPRSPKHKHLQTALRARLVLRCSMSEGTGARAERLWPLMRPFWHQINCLSLNAMAQKDFAQARVPDTPSHSTAEPPQTPGHCSSGGRVPQEASLM